MDLEFSDGGGVAGKMLIERLPESLSECDRQSVGGIGDPASSGRDRRSIEITDLGYNCGASLRFLLGNRSRESRKSIPRQYQGAGHLSPLPPLKERGAKAR